MSSRKRRRILFRVAAVALGLLPLVALEITLRLCGVPTAKDDLEPLVNLHQLEPLFVSNADATLMEIPAARSNYFQPASFTLPKPQGEFRIFALGGSTVQGRPYATETAFPKWLELSLHAADPSQQWNAINCGGVSYASYRVAAILDEVIKYEPDLILLYTGHNEFLEDRTYGNWKRVPRWLAIAQKPIADLHTTRLLGRWFRSSNEAKPELDWTPNREVDTRLDHIGGLEAYTRDNAWRMQVIEHFHHELERMLKTCAEHDVPIVVCVPVSDLVDTPPFKVEVSADLTGDRKRQALRDWDLVLHSTDARARREAAESLLAVDPAHAGAAFYVGREELERRDVSAARRWLIHARDTDVCPLRAPTEIEDSVRELCRKYSVPMIDVARRCEQESRAGIVGADLLVDHVHPSIETHQKIAGWVLDLLEQEGVVERRQGFAQRRQALFQEQLSQLDESYFARGQQRLAGLKQWAAGRAGKTPLQPSTK